VISTSQMCSNSQAILGNMETLLVSPAGKPRGFITQFDKSFDRHKDVQHCPHCRESTPPHSQRFRVVFSNYWQLGKSPTHS
jgi:hypothetical protein